MIISPGSRNAPLIAAFTNDPFYRCISVVDERSAAFTALGMSLENKEPVAIVCSSGSAAVNFYPAIVEAFYQKLPLVIITADRPREVIDQASGQTIRQEGVFSNHILFEANLLRNRDDQLTHAYNQRLINEALHNTHLGPVHINAPFTEPLYDLVDVDQLEAPKLIRKPQMIKSIPEAEMEALAKLWDESKKIIVLIGQHSPSSGLNKAMDELNEHSPFLVMSETLSHVETMGNIRSIDRFINTLSEKQLLELAPDLLITIGGEVVSKMIKKYFKEHSPGTHWHLGEEHSLKDTFGRLSHHLEADPQIFFTDLREIIQTKEVHYRDIMMTWDRQKAAAHKEYLNQASFSDLKALELVLENLPDQSIIHTANSASVRYAQLFDHKGGLVHYANRGTSGIDGCTSTAIGHAMCTHKMVTLVSGDIAFLYDSNAFWNNQLPANFRVIVLNNQGGNIFRIIQGPDHNENFEQFQETTHQLNLKGVAETFGLEFISVSQEDELKEALPSFFEQSNSPKILEVKTPRLENPVVLKNYFEYIRAQSVDQ